MMYAISNIIVISKSYRNPKSRDMSSSDIAITVISQKGPIILDLGVTTFQILKNSWEPPDHISFREYFINFHAEMSRMLLKHSV